MLSLTMSAAALAALYTTVQAQVPTFQIDDIPLATRQQWCTSQITQCPLICLQEEAETAATEANNCDTASLTYTCICDNGLSPNASEYSQTLPYYICTQNNELCVSNCGLANNACASSCREDHPCGAQSPTRVNTSTISTMIATATDGSASATGSDVVYNGFGGNSAETTAASSQDSNTDSAAVRLALNAGEKYGLGVVAAGIFTGFAFFM